MIRAKFQVNEVAKTRYGTSLRAQPVYSDKEGSENKKFWEASPSGSFEVTGTKPGIFDDFKPGDEFYLDVTKA